MKLRLRITAPTGEATTFEHAGPAVRVGRDPAGELALDGPHSASVSWNHARIDLAAGGATLTDTHSSNRTLLNDRALPADEPVPLHNGDRIQLGYTGPTLSVLALDLSAPPLEADPKSETRNPKPRQEARASFRISPVWVVGLGAAAVLTTVAVVALVAVVSLARSGRSPEADPGATPEVVQVPPRPTPPARPTEPPAPTAPTPVKTAPPAPTKPPAPTGEPALTVQEVGRLVAPKDGFPGLVLQRLGESSPWVPLRDGDTMRTAHTLVCLPGYRAVLAIGGAPGGDNAAVLLTLWGNLPELLPAPVLECVVMLNAPADGLDLDLTLARGRVRLANLKAPAAGPARVRLRFPNNEVWDATLADPDSELDLEVWAERALPGAGRPASEHRVTAYARGTIALRIPRGTFALASPTRLASLGEPGGPLRSEPLTALPGWWSGRPDLKNPAVASVLLSLKDLHAAVFKNLREPVVGRLLVLARGESPEGADRALAVMFLAALDEVEDVVEFLEDRQSAPVRFAAVYGVRAWLARYPSRREQLAHRLQEWRRSSPEQVELILRLLADPPQGAASRPETYQELIGHLEHDTLIVRQLALWQLVRLVGPQQAAAVPYDPAKATPEERKAGIEAWKRLIAAQAGNSRP